MEPTLVVDWSREALRMALMLGAPALLAALAAAVVVGLVQTMMQMHEPVIGLIPRMAAVIVVVMMLLPWLLSTWVAYAVELIGSLPSRM